jgi:hypothetical protein
VTSETSSVNKAHKYSTKGTSRNYIKLSPERKGRTKTVETKGNPVWNETLKFHYDPRMETDIECGSKLDT